MNKATCLLMLCLWCTSIGYGQQLYQVQSGTVAFVSDTPITTIKAVNDQVKGVLDLSSGVVNISFYLRDFQFPNAIMQEHFNSDFVQSDRFPMASFTGLLQLPEQGMHPGQSNQKIEMEGTLTLHGQSQKMRIAGTLSTQDHQLSGTANFPITLTDFGIEVPGILQFKLATEVQVAVKLHFQPLVK